MPVFTTGATRAKAATSGSQNVALMMSKSKHSCSDRLDNCYLRCQSELLLTKPEKPEKTAKLQELAAKTSIIDYGEQCDQHASFGKLENILL